jgi:dienelactone hydrolase
VGRGKITIDAAGTPLEVHTYKPQGYTGGAILLTLHGVSRNAAGYRDYASAIADRHGFLVAAPLFDRKRFPPWRYQGGGIVRYDSKSIADEAQAPEQRTDSLLLAIARAIRAAENAPNAPLYLLGHSGGAQALLRVAAFTHDGAQRIVIANPGTYLWPSRETRFPDGFGGLPRSLADDEYLKRYLAQPITLLLGTADVLQDEDLSMRPTAAVQGANRYERGHNAYAAARELATARGWPFNWRVVDVPGVGHSAGPMFRSREAIAAFAEHRHPRADGDPVGSGIPPPDSSTRGQASRE